VTRVNRLFRFLDPLDPRHAALAELGGQVLHGGEHELFLGAEVVLHQPQGHPGLGRDLAHPGGVQSARGRCPQQRLGDLPPPFLMIDPLGHALTVPLLAHPPTL
jgi:hypothetical protein